MTLAPGTRLGTYEIVEPLGAGGMGEVYRARDAKLKRDVAIKILPEEFSKDPERVSRFQREAEALAALSHQNIAAIYDLQQSDTTRFLVLELVEGDTLADVLSKRGALPVDEALQIAKQICEALEAAHEKGIVHRDLKPANVKVMADGKVKVLDFGLAKAVESAPVSSALSNSPTLTMAATNAGVILGTAAYMSPEQAKGRAVDKRADIFAFGCLLYEMVTGRKAFEGDDVHEILGAVLKIDPDWSRLPNGTPRAIHRLLRRALKKDPRQRLGDIRDARIEIEEAENEEPVALAPAPVLTGQSPWHRMLPWTVAVAAVVVGIVGALAPWRSAPQPPEITRISMDVGTDASLLTAAGAAAILSPDGKVFAFVAGKVGGRSQIYIRRMDQLESMPLSGTEGAVDPFFSPDGLWIGFFAEGKLKKASVTGGGALTLCDAPRDRGGTWSEDDSIIFAPENRGTLFRVASGGGKPEPVTKLDQNEVTHRWPDALPGGQAVLFAAATNGNTASWDDANIVVESVPTGERKILQRGGYHPKYIPTGHLIYLRQGTLFAAPFDVRRLEMTAPPVPVIQGVVGSPVNGGAQFDFSRNGHFVYQSGGAVGDTNPAIYWMDKKGKTQPLRPNTGNFYNLRFSPDGTQLAMEILAQGFDIWIYEWARDTLSRLTFDQSPDRHPVWTPDGRRITYDSTKGTGGNSLYWQRADGTGTVERLTESKNFQIPNSWHPSRKFLAFQELQGQAQFDIMILPVDGNEASGWKPGKPTTFLGSPFNEGEAAFSPDGRWLAYSSNESGSFEIYVRPFPGPGGKWQISDNGGNYPTWSPNGKELFYRTSDQKIMVTTYMAQADSFRADKPRSWSEGQFTDRGSGVRNFDLHPDGQRFAILKNPEGRSESKLDKVVLIQNFFDEVRRLAPTKN
jgi:serine/threonine protein kinase/Tol biopolymer transport system component